MSTPKIPWILSSLQSLVIQLLIGLLITRPSLASAFRTYSWFSSSNYRRNAVSIRSCHLSISSQGWLRMKQMDTLEEHKAASPLILFLPRLYEYRNKMLGYLFLWIVVVFYMCCLLSLKKHNITITYHF